MLKRFLGPFIVLVALPACSVGPDFVRPNIDVAANWIDKDDVRLKRNSGDQQFWWKGFNDSELNRLIERAYHSNLTIQQAGARIMEARAQLGVATGSLYPQSQQFTSSLSSVRSSQRSQQASFARTFDYAQSQFGITANWELDFWGKFRRSIESAEANLQAAEADYDSALVSLVADVARAYIASRTLQNRLKIARQDVETQMENLHIAEVRLSGGTTSGRDVEQAKTVLANTQASIPTLEISLRQELNALCVLLGKPPQSMSELLDDSAEIPAPPAHVVVGIPADLLRRRPDVRRAELQAASQSAAIGVTKAALYPAISLTGTFGFLSTDVGSFALSDVFLRKSRAANFGPALQWNIFNYGQITNQVRVQDARLQQQLLNYQNTVISAQREVENSLVAFLRLQDRVQALAESTAAAQGSLNLAMVQYRQGITDFTTVLTAQQALLAEQDSLVSTLGDISISLVAVYRALGGGWEIREGNDVLPDAVKVQMAKRTNWGDLLAPSGKPSSSFPAPRW